MDRAADTQAPFRLKIVPIAVTVALGLGLPIAAAFAAAFSHKYFGAPAPSGSSIWWIYSEHTFQGLFALIAIFIVKRFVPANYGLRLPRGRSYIGPALFWGAVFGVLMTLVDYAPQLLAHSVPKLDYPFDAKTIAGWLSFEGVYVGPTEEILFRSLLVTYLIAAMPGKLRIARFDMSWGGILVAAIFALAHMSSFWSEPWYLALGQQLYAFALGVLYAYWLEKSGSVLAPMIGHNAGDVVETGLLFLWVALAR